MKKKIADYLDGMLARNSNFELLMFFVFCWWLYPFTYYFMGGRQKNPGRDRAVAWLSFGGVLFWFLIVYAVRYLMQGAQ